MMYYMQVQIHKYNMNPPCNYTWKINYPLPTYEQVYIGPHFMLLRSDPSLMSGLELAGTVNPYISCIDVCATLQTCIVFHMSHPNLNFQRNICIVCLFTPFHTECKQGYSCE